MNLKTDRYREKYPIEFPSKENVKENSPVIEGEIFPYELKSRSFYNEICPDYHENIENITTETILDKAEQTIL